MAKTFTKKTAAIALAAGLAFSGSAGAAFAPVAGAQPAEGQEATAAGLDIKLLADENWKGNITIHKKKNAASHGKPDVAGHASENVAGDALKGATFTVQKLNLDLSKEEDFAKAAKLQKTENGLFGLKEGENTTQVTDMLDPAFTAQEATTDGDGKAELKGLPAGVYYVTETGVPNSETEVYIPSAPFLVYLPMADNDKNEWNKDVHVYPKNTQVTTEKTVKDEGKHGAADQEEDRILTYTITSNAPLLPPKRELTELVSVDTYKKDDFKGDLKVKSVKLYDASGAEIKGTGENGALKEGDDYTVSEPTTLPADQQIKDGDKVLGDTQRTVTLTSTDLLAKVKNGGKMVVELEGEVATYDKIADGEVTNQAHTRGKTTVVGDPSYKYNEKPDEFETPKDRVDSYFAAVKVVKHDAAGEDQLLEGAEFKVYSVAGDKQCTDPSQKVIQETLKAEKGVGIINGLHVVNYVNDVAVNTPADQLKFCIVETKAPSGYALNDTPIELTNVTKEQATNPQADDVTKLLFTSDVKVPNTKRPGFELPQTGGMGVLVMILGGLALLGGGAYAARRKA